jgi:hypothetical protein
MSQRGGGGFDQPSGRAGLGARHVRVLPPLDDLFCI